MQDKTITYSDSVVKHMNAVPRLLEDWQYEDLGNNNVGGYYQNPVAVSGNQIISISSQILTSCNGVSTLSAISVAANNLFNSSNNFVAHTDRISGMVEPNQDTAELPHYATILSSAKTLSYLCYQNSGVSNNAVIIGNFSSLYTANNISDYRTAISGYPTTINNSIYYETDPIDPLIQTKKSNLSSGIITTISNKLNEISTYMSTKQSSDVNFFNNSKSIVGEMNSVKKLSNMGSTEKYLAQTLIGTDKLKARIT